MLYVVYFARVQPNTVTTLSDNRLKLSDHNKNINFKISNEG